MRPRRSSTPSSPRARWSSGSAKPSTSCRLQFDASAIEIDPVTAQIVTVLQEAGDSGTQFGYNIDVMAPPAFNDMMQNGFQAMLNGDKTAEQQAADLQAAWEEGMPAAEATPTS